MDVRIAATSALSKSELRSLRSFLDEAFEGGLTDEDWEHTVGGLHVLGVDDGIVCHAAVVERLLMAGDRPLRTGYVESVATAARLRGRGHASTVMRAIGEIIRANYDLGALSTGVPGFYARLGWEPWRGPTFTSSPNGPRRTQDEDGGVMVLRTRVTRELDSTMPLTCDWRSGDVW